MNTRTRFASLSILLLMVFGLQAQTKYTKYYEFGAGLGTLNMSNDIANSGRVSAFFAEVSPALNVFAKYHFNDWLGMGADIQYANLTAADINHENSNRGLSVTTSLLNSNAFLEAHFIRFGKYHLDDKYTIFIKGGIGVSGWNPELTFNDLIPQDVEVETNAYSGLSNFYAIGAKYRLSYHGILTFEFRYTNAGGDTMDGFIDLSPQATNENNSFWGFSLSYSYAIL